MYEYSTEGLVADGCAGVARWSRLARRSRLELDYDLHASSLVRCGWVLGFCWVRRKAYFYLARRASNRAVYARVSEQSVHPTAHSTRCRDA